MYKTVLSCQESYKEQHPPFFSLDFVVLRYTLLTYHKKHPKGILVVTHVDKHAKKRHSVFLIKLKIGEL